MPETVPDSLSIEIALFEARKHELESTQWGKFVVIRGNEVLGAFDTLEIAGYAAAQKYGAGPYLIRQVGAPPWRLPAWFAFSRTEVA